MSEWLPIETAPKDGAEILAYGCDGRVIAQWRDNEWCQQNSFTSASALTHWMPLPEPPTAPPPPKAQG